MSLTSRWKIAARLSAGAGLIAALVVLLHALWGFVRVLMMANPPDGLSQMTGFFGLFGAAVLALFFYVVLRWRNGAGLGIGGVLATLMIMSGAASRGLAFLFAVAVGQGATGLLLISLPQFVIFVSTVLLLVFPSPVSLANLKREPS